MEAKEETKQLTLVDTFHLYLWTMWKGGALAEDKVAQVLAFCKKLGPDETVDYCFAELDELRKKYAPPQEEPPKEEKKDEADSIKQG